MIVMALAAAATALAPADSAIVPYLVKRGDTLIGIGNRYMLPAAWQKVRRINHIRNPDRMPVGISIDIPERLLRVEPIAAQVVAFRGVVTIDGAGVALGAPVREGMAITTGANGSITVECADGSRFSLPSQSTVGVARLRRVLLNGDLERRFTVRRGRGDWHAAPAPTNGSRFMVTTPVSVSAVRGTGFRVGYEDIAGIGVIEGTVGVSDPALARTEALPKGLGISVDKAGVGPPAPLLAAPELARPGAVQSLPLLAFAVRPVPGAVRYAFELGSDAGLIDRFAERRTEDTGAQFEGLPDGRYFVRVTATDARGIDGFASTYAFERLSFSGEAAAVDRGAYRFRWSSGAGGRSIYRFSLASDQAMTTPLIDRDGLAINQITVTDLKPGTYWWRVMVTRFEGGRAVTAVNEPQSLTIAPRG